MPGTGRSDSRSKRSFESECKESASGATDSSDTGTAGLAEASITTSLSCPGSRPKNSTTITTTTSTFSSTNSIPADSDDRLATASSASASVQVVRERRIGLVNASSTGSFFANDLSSCLEGADGALAAFQFFTAPGELWKTAVAGAAQLGMHVDFHLRLIQESIQVINLYTY